MLPIVNPLSRAATHPGYSIAGQATMFLTVEHISLSWEHWTSLLDHFFTNHTISFLWDFVLIFNSFHFLCSDNINETSRADIVLLDSYTSDGVWSWRFNTITNQTGIQRKQLFTTHYPQQKLNITYLNPVKWEHSVKQLHIWELRNSTTLAYASPEPFPDGLQWPQIKYV